MRPSLFNVPVPLTDRDDVFLLNTFTDAQAIVSADVMALLDRLAHDPAHDAGLTGDARDTIDALREAGFLVDTHEQERSALREHFDAFRDDTSQLRVTVLTTLQCNFACEYCVQGDHASADPRGQRMTTDTAAQTLAWIEARLDELRPRSFVLTFFGGEPLLNLPVVYQLAEHAWQACQARGVTMLVNVITNGLLLTPEVVDRLHPFGLNGVKVTLDGDRHTHDRQRPLRGGQGTFDRIITNVRAVAGRCRVSVGGNFEGDATGAFVELLDYLAAQDFAPLLDKVAFKPVIRQSTRPPSAVIPLTLVRPGQAATAAPAPTRPAPSSPCDTCHFVDEQLTTLREETRARGFRTIDGVHMGPCEIHKRHAYTIGPDGALYACPGFTGDAQYTVGHVDGERAHGFARASDRLARLSPWREACGDCAFVPVCGGGCSVAAHAEHQDLLAPSCHKAAFEAATVSLAHEAAPFDHPQPGDHP